ncbi:hypothetical protein TWF281_009180 [Arthrobotrys megalospora]
MPLGADFFIQKQLCLRDGAKLTSRREVPEYHRCLLSEAPAALWEKLDPKTGVEDKDATPGERAYFYYRGIEMYTRVENTSRVLQLFAEYVEPGVQDEKAMLWKYMENSSQPLSIFDRKSILLGLGRLGRGEDARKLIPKLWRDGGHKCSIFYDILTFYHASMFSMGLDEVIDNYVPDSINQGAWHMILGREPGLDDDDLEYYTSSHPPPTTRRELFKEAAFFCKVALNSKPEYFGPWVPRRLQNIAKEAGLLNLLFLQFREHADVHTKRDYVVNIRGHGHPYHDYEVWDILFHAAGRLKNYDMLEEIMESFRGNRELDDLFSFKHDVGWINVRLQLRSAIAFAQYVWSAAMYGRWDVAFRTKNEIKNYFDAHNGRDL